MKDLKEEDLRDIDGGLKASLTQRPYHQDIDSKDPKCTNCKVPLSNMHEYGDGYDLFVCVQCGQDYRHYYVGDEWTLNRN